MTYRVHYQPEGRALAACSIAPVVYTTADAARVTCARCKDMIRSGHERTRPLPKLRRTA